MDLEDLDLAPATLLLLWATRETGALDALASDADTPTEVAESAGIDERAADLVVTALEREGFLDRVGDAYEPTNRMLGFLAAADLRSVGRLPAALDTVEALVALPETMATGGPPADESAGTPPTDESADDDESADNDGSADDLHRRLGARAATDDATVRAVTTAAVRQAPDAERVLDVRGAPGHHAKAFARLGREATLADRRAAVERSTSLLAPTDVETDAIESDESLPDADLVFAGNVVRRLAPADAKAFVARLADAAAPDGTVVVADLVRGRSERDVPAAVTAFARDGGTVHSEADLAAWFEAAGLGTPDVVDVPGTDRQVVTGHHRGDG